MKYQENYPELYIEICKKQGSICDFCVAVGIGRRTFYDWCDAYPEFADAHKLGKEITEQWLTRAGIDGMHAERFNGTVWSILMRNKCGYAEHRKVKIDFTGCTTTADKMALLDKRVSQGRLTPREAKDWIEYIKTNAEVNEKTELAQKVDTLMELAGKK